MPEIEVTNGQNIINIITDDLSNVLVIEKAVAVNWPDCMGSVAEYYAVSNYNYEKQKELTAGLNKAVIEGSDTEIIAAINTFMDLFSNGSYNIYINEIDPEFSAIYSNHQRKRFSWLKREDEKFTSHFYPHNNIYLFSRTYKSIDKKRVKEYVSLIQQGARPKVIVYFHYYNDACFNSPYYILDGHHKLLAYQELGMKIPAIYINKTDLVDKPSDNLLLQILHILNPTERKHVLKHHPDTTSFMHPVLTETLDDILKNDSNINTQICCLLRQAYNSTDEAVRQWSLKRLSILKKNIHKGRGLRVYYFKNEYGHWAFHLIEKDADFDHWENIFLKAKDIPPYR
jgi:hypothetical protein